MVFKYCTIGISWLCVKSTLNVHKDRTLESRNSKNTYDFLVQVGNFLLPLSLKVLRYKERYTHSFYSGFFICPPSHATPAQGLREQAKINRLLARQVSTLLTDWFFQNSPNPPRASGAWRHSPSRAIVTSLSDTSAPHTRVNTCVNVAPK